MLSLTDMLLVAAILVPTGALFGHLWVAYKFAPRRIEAALDGPLGTRLMSRVGSSFIGWADSPEGSKLISDLIDDSASEVPNKLIAWARTAEGGAAVAELGKAVVSGIGQSLKTTALAADGRAHRKAQGLALDLFDGLKTRNPVADGLIAMIPADVKKQIGGRLFGMMREMMLQQVAQEADFRTVEAEP